MLVQYIPAEIGVFALLEPFDGEGGSSRAE